MTTDQSSDMAILMPLASIIALGSGTQGHAALRTWGGVSVAEFQPGFSEMLRTLESDPESAASVPILQLVADVAGRATSWLHVTTDGMREERTYLVLVDAEESLIAGIHGPLVEWVCGSHDVLSRCLSSLLGTEGDATVLLTCFDEDSPIAGLRFANGAVDVTAASPEAFTSLTSAAGQGVDQLALALASLPVASVRT